MARVIAKNNLGELAAYLTKHHQVVVPVKDATHASYDQIHLGVYEPGQEIALPYGTTILPPKEYILPPKETLYHFGAFGYQLEKTAPLAFLGPNLEDLEGIERLDKIFAAPISDEPYENRQKNRVIVAVDHYTAPVEASYDLYLMWLNSESLVGFAKTKYGRELLKLPIFKEKKVKVPTVKRGKDPILSRSDLPKIIEASKNHPVWKELAKTCFGCGICSYVCPLCYCFEVEDEITNPDKKEGNRIRNWDSCLLPHFAETTFHNFRPALEARLYNWYYHKFVRMPKEQGFYGCTGCNRCVIYCPARINYRTVLTRLIKDYEKGAGREKSFVHSAKS